MNIGKFLELATASRKNFEGIDPCLDEFLKTVVAGVTVLKSTQDLMRSIQALQGCKAKSAR